MRWPRRNFPGLNGRGRMHFGAATLAVVLLVVVSDGVGRCEGPESIQRVLQQVRAHYSATGFEADFSQQARLGAVGITETAAGHLYFKPPAMMRWHYRSPDDYLVISDAERVWIYRPQDNQVMVGAATGDVGGGGLADFFSNADALLKDFKIEWAPKAMSAPDHFALRLTPYKPQDTVAELFVFVSKQDTAIDKVMVYNAFGDQTTIRFSGFRFVHGLDRSLFEFKIPEGAEVMNLDAPPQGPARLKAKDRS